jgi:cobalt-zinc-cadmium efflux system membrane fusion protein
MHDIHPLTLTLLLCAVGLFGACKGQGNPAEKEAQPAAVERRNGSFFVPDASPLRQRLTVQPVTTETVQRQLVAPASVEAEPSRLAKIAPPLPGRVVKLFVHFGDSLKEGAPLFTLDSPDLVSAQSEYLKAKSALAQGERNLARQKDLKEHGIGAQRELEQAQTDRDTAESELERASTRLRLLHASAGGVGGPLTVTSPISGRVIDLATAPGQYQNDPAAVLMTIADLSTVWLTANVQEKDVRRVHQGDDATASFAAYPGEAFVGQVLFVGDLLDPDTRTIKVRVSFKNGDFRLKPGMFATVMFRSKPSPEIVAPTAAVVISGEKSGVFVEIAPWTFEKRNVEVGEQVGDKIVVTKGLEPGMRIVATNAVLLP